jgi:gluconolactonase
MTAPRVVASGLRFPEGPTWLGDGSVAVVEMKGESVSRVAADGTVTVLGDCGGGPNGSAPGASGEVYVANNGGLSAEGTGYWHAPHEFDGRVQRVDPDGTVTTVGGTLPGEAPHRPNDLCFGPDGTLYVTDSANWEDLRNIRPGRIVAIGPEGTQLGHVEVPAMPNGRLYLSQSLTRKVLAFEVSGGEFGEPQQVLKLASGMPDGFAFDGDGTLYVCGSVGNVVHVYAGGELTESIETGDGTQPTNCCVGADGSLYVTFGLSGQLVAYDLGLTPATVHTGTIVGGAA